MRTTLSIDDDVIERARAVAGKLSTPFKTVVTKLFVLAWTKWNNQRSSVATKRNLTKWASGTAAI